MTQYEYMITKDYCEWSTMKKQYVLWRKKSGLLGFFYSFREIGSFKTEKEAAQVAKWLEAQE